MRLSDIKNSNLENYCSFQMTLLYDKLQMTLLYYEKCLLYYIIIKGIYKISVHHEVREKFILHMTFYNSFQ